MALPVSIGASEEGDVKKKTPLSGETGGACAQCRVTIARFFANATGEPIDSRYDKNSHAL
jgi:hypothetical protein